MYIRIRCTTCRIHFDSVRTLLEHMATHSTVAADGDPTALSARGDARAASKIDRRVGAAEKGAL